MKLKDQINQKLAQGIPDEDALDMIFDEMVDSVTSMFPKEQEDKVFMALFERLKWFLGAE